MSSNICAYKLSRDSGNGAHQLCKVGIAAKMVGVSVEKHKVVQSTLMWTSFLGLVTSMKASVLAIFHRKQVVQL